MNTQETPAETISVGVLSRKIGWLDVEIPVHLYSMRKQGMLQKEEKNFS
jgi:hypothetical protein